MAEDLSGGSTQLPPIGRVRRYLRENGWTETALPDREMVLFSKDVSDIGVVEIVLPSTPRFDVEERVTQAIRSLSSVEGTSFEHTADKVRLFSIDAVEAILPNEKVFLDGISLALAEQVVSFLRSLIIRAASHELAVRSGFVEDDLNSFAATCKFAHTFRGSFGFRLESIVGPNSGIEQQPVPFERRVTQRVARGLRSIGQAVADNSQESLLRGSELGFGDAECAAVAEYLEETRAQSLCMGIRFANCWKVDDDLSPRVSTDLTKSALPFVRAAAEQLKPHEVALLPHNVRGRIIALSSKHIPRDLLHPEGREITIVTDDFIGREVRVHVRISAQQYIAAVDAHLRGEEVRASGLTRRSGNQLRMDDVRSFSVGPNRLQLPTPR